MIQKSLPYGSVLFLGKSGKPLIFRRNPLVVRQIPKMLFASAMEILSSLIVSHLLIQRMGLGRASVLCSCPEEYLPNPLVPPDNNKNHHFIHSQIFCTTCMQNLRLYENRKIKILLYVLKLKVRGITRKTQ